MSKLVIANLKMNKNSVEMSEYLKELDAKEEKATISMAQSVSEGTLEKRVATLEKQMKAAAENLDFEKAIELRNEITRLQKGALGI